MLTITPTQWTTLSGQARQQFGHRAVAHLRQRYPAHCQGKDDTRLLQHVDALLAFAARHRVTRRGNVLRLIDLQARTGFNGQVSAYALYRLRQDAYDESTRVRHFAQALGLARPPTLIDLNTPLEAAEAAHV